MELKFGYDMQLKQMDLQEIAKEKNLLKIEKMKELN